MRIYFAAPLFCEAELRFNERVCGMLEEQGHSAFLPQRDGVELGEGELPEGASTKEEGMLEVFEIDRTELLDADLVTAVLDGRVPDEGVMIELGMAHEHDIPLIGLKTDVRLFGEGEPLNAMVYGVLDEITESPEELVEAVEAHAGAD